MGQMIKDLVWRNKGKALIAIATIELMLSFVLKTHMMVLSIPGAYILLGLFWGIIDAWIIQAARYYDATGRYLWKDRYQFGRSTMELIRYFSKADPYHMDVSSLPIENWRGAEGVILGKVGNRLVKRSAFEHNGDGSNFILFALPGSGKTTAQIIPSALRFGGAVLCIDIKGDVYRNTKSTRKIKVFAPDDPKLSCKFNPLYGIDSMSLTERKVLVEMLSKILVPDDKNGKYFVECGRDCFCGITLYLLDKDIRLPFSTIIREILQGDAISWITRIRDSDCFSAQEYTNSYYGTNETNVLGGYGEMRKRIRTLCTDELLQLLESGDDSLTPDDLMSGKDVYIIIPQHKVDFYAPISTIIVQRFMTSFMSREDTTTQKDSPILFLLDEFPQLRFDFQTLSAGLATLRSRHVSIFIVAQSIAQLSNRYGEESCREIIDTCAYISVMSAQDPRSRRFFQELIGTRKVLKTVTSIGTAPTENKFSRSIQEDRECIIQPEDFGNLDDKVLIYALGKYVVAEKTFYFQ